MYTISDLAEILGVTEFEIFERAYVHWYGRPGELLNLEREFGQYLMGRKGLPIYVRSFLGKQHFLIA